MPHGDAVPIQIVDENDKPVGTASIGEACRRGLIHRIVRVMVEDTNGRILLQKRNETRETYPNCWDNSAAGHVDGGESYETAAARELKEEVGIEGFSLHEVATYRTSRVYKGMQLNRFNKLYTVIVPTDTPVHIQEEEVAGAQWFDRDEIQQLIVEGPDKISDGLLEVFEKYYSK